MTDKKRKFLEVCKRCIYSTKSGDVRICLGQEAVKNGTNWTITCEAWSDLGKCDIFKEKSSDITEITTQME